MGDHGLDGTDSEQRGDNEFEGEHGPSSSYARSIELPAEETFRNLRNAKTFAIDIGESYYMFYQNIYSGNCLIFRVWFHYAEEESHWH